VPLDILIVDDSAAIRKILQRVLGQTEIAIGSIYEAGDGAAALEILRKQQVGLVLSDINMPNMDGLELLSRIKSSADWRKVPVIMITTESGAAKVKEAVELGANGYVRKPFTAEQIKEKLAGLV
jgi:two-component system chemotaxis response regulator CheY